MHNAQLNQSLLYRIEIRNNLFHPSSSHIWAIAENNVFQNHMVLEWTKLKNFFSSRIRPAGFRLGSSDLQGSSTTWMFFRRMHLPQTQWLQGFEVRLHPKNGHVSDFTFIYPFSENFFQFPLYFRLFILRF